MNAVEFCRLVFIVLRSIIYFSSLSFHERHRLHIVNRPTDMVSNSRQIRRSLKMLFIYRPSEQWDKKIVLALHTWACMFHSRFQPAFWPPLPQFIVPLSPSLSTRRDAASEMNSEIAGKVNGGASKTGVRGPYCLDMRKERQNLVTLHQVAWSKPTVGRHCHQTAAAYY